MTRIIPAGKLPNELLGSIISSLSVDDPSLLVGPGVGEDAAVVDLAPSSLIVLKSDPITFATDRIGFYAVTVNANDIVTTGATVRWFLPTLLFPLETTEVEIRGVFSEIAATASAIGVTVCGGHTEVSSAVTRPVVCGAMIGAVDEHKLKRKDSIVPGDVIVMTKTAGNEGTAILAREFPERLVDDGIGTDTIAAAGSFLDRLSIIPEARIAASYPSVRAMHDVTEGGMATALYEVSAASGCGIEIDLDKSPVDPVTETLCRACGLDPLGLIGSGSLLTVIGADLVDDYLEALTKAEIPAAAIGRVTDRTAGLRATMGGKSTAFPHFETDEIARMFG